MNDAKNLITEDNEKLVNLAKMGDETAKEKLVLKNLKLIYGIVNKYIASEKYKRMERNYLYEKEDLITLGVEVLLNSIDNFDVEKGKFSTYFSNNFRFKLCTINMKLYDTIFFSSLDSEDLKKNRTQAYSVEDIKANSNFESMLDNIDLSIIDNIAKTCLTDREYKVFKERNFGLDRKETTFEGVATKFNCSRENIRYMDKRILNKIRREFEKTYKINLEP